jgi:hypothetical protein
MMSLNTLSEQLRCLGVLFPVLAVASQPLALHPDNPHYFVFRGKPTVLITSAEHYGVVLNGAFDYRKYIDTLAANRMNLTRAFSGLYREVPGESFNIARNTLAPEEPDFIQPFRRIAPQKYDLSQWNDQYFRRWRDFVSYAGQREIVVEVTLFTSYYNPKHWSLSPLNTANNIQGIGKVRSDEALTLKEPALVDVQERFVRKLVTELKDFDNVYYEICNEPYVHGVAEEWQRRMARAIADTEAQWPERHLISRNIANGSAEVRDLDPLISIFNFHYARPPRAVAENYALNKPVGMNETGFDGTADSPYRIQAWDFLLAGGALYNNLDYSFTVGHEDGSFNYPSTQPGGGSTRLRKQLKILRDFMDSVPLTTMRPDPSILIGTLPENVSARAISDAKSIWAIYLHGGKTLDGYSPKYVVYSRRQSVKLPIHLPAGTYEVRWWNPRGTGPSEDPVALTHSGGAGTLETPQYSEDLAAIIRKR